MREGGNMNLKRIRAIILRHTLGWTRKWDQLLELVYWPVLDMIMWGVTTVWLVKADAESASVATFSLITMMTCLVMWQMVWRANQEVGLNFLEEIWNRNVVNLFASPLTLSEWTTGLLMLSLLKIFLAMIVGTLAAYLLYALNLTTFGFEVIPFLGVIVLWGWTVGFLSVAIILRFGKQLQHVAWTLCALFGPISAVYFPVASLPKWLQHVSAMIPTSHAFEGVRAAMISGRVELTSLVIAYSLGLIYFAGAIMIFRRAFEHRLEMGLQGMD
jgi:ABC-2 type transport system permease protein